MLARIGTPTTREDDSCRVRYEKTRFAEDVRIGLAVEPGRAATGTKGERESAIPPAVQSVTAALSAC
jgi:hypothetical protein